MSGKGWNKANGGVATAGCPLAPAVVHVAIGVGRVTIKINCNWRLARVLLHIGCRRTDYIEINSISRTPLHRNKLACEILVFGFLEHYRRVSVKMAVSERSAGEIFHARAGCSIGIGRLDHLSCTRERKDQRVYK